MIEKDNIIGIIVEYLHDKELFLVDTVIDKDNNIDVTIESEDGCVSLDDCVNLSKYMEARLDRDKDDYSLTVGSAGLTSPFKVLKQYLKFEGKEVEVTLGNGSRIKGILSSVTPESISLTYNKSEKVEGQKKKATKEVVETFDLKELKSTKPVIRFNK